jgi:hypothetical protein
MEKHVGTRKTFLSRGLGLASAWQSVAQLAALDLPHTHGAVPARGGEESDVGRKRDSCDPVAMLRGEQLTRAEGPGRPRGGRGRRQLPQAHGSAPSRAVVRPGPPRSPTGRRSQVCRHALACAAPGAHDLSEEPDASQTVVRSGAPACPGVPGGQRARAQSSAGTQSVCPTLRGVVERGIGMRSSHVREVCGRAGVRHQAEE